MSSCDDNDDETAVTTHYGVSITLSSQNEPEETGAEANPIVVDDEDPFVTVESRVFVSRDDALKCLKSLTKKFGKDKATVRLKAFEGRQEALDFSASVSPPTKPSPPAKEQEEEGNQGEEETSLPVLTMDPPPTPPPSEGCPFKSLTPQQMKQVKEAIKKGDDQTFCELTQSNPRYLVTPSDTPAICHSGTRANALHVAAESGSLHMTNVVLDAIQNPDLMMAMYPDEPLENRVRRQEHIFDLYLNSQVKGSFDTPLHQAAKIGAIDVVAALVSFSSCDTKVRNKFDLTPADVACTRMGNPDPMLSDHIKKLLGDHVYIPVFRVSDHSMPSFVGEPWSPRPLNNSINEDNNVTDLAALSPVLIKHQLGTGGDHGQLSPVSHNVSTPRPRNNDPKPPKSPYILKTALDNQAAVSTNDSFHLSDGAVAVQALLGPLSPLQADYIKMEWKKPKNNEERLIRLSDPIKGVERHGRQLAKRCEETGGGAVNMIEYWEFLDAYVDLSTPVGMEALDEHLRQMAENNVNKNDTNRSNQQANIDDSIVLHREDSDPFSDLLSGFGGLKLSDNKMSTCPTFVQGDVAQQKTDDPATRNHPPPATTKESSLMDVVKQMEKKPMLRVQELQAPAPSLLSPNTLWNRPRVVNQVAASPGFGEPETPARGSHFHFPMSVDEVQSPVQPIQPPVNAAFRENVSDGSESDDDCGSSFHTVASSFDSCLTAEEGQWVFMQGTVPTEADSQVFQIIRDATVDKALFPYLAVWKDMMSTYSEDQQSAWPKLPEKSAKQKTVKTNFDSVTKKLFHD